MLHAKLERSSWHEFSQNLGTSLSTSSTIEAIAVDVTLEAIAEDVEVRNVEGVEA